jgi:hypothetical protein
MMNKIKLITKQWLIISCCCAGILIATNKVYEQYLINNSNTAHIYKQQMADNNLWAPLKDKQQKPVETTEPVTEAKEAVSDNAVLIKEQKDATILENNESEKVEDIAVDPKPIGANPIVETKPITKPKPAEIKKSKKSILSNGIECPNNADVTEHLYKGMWKNDSDVKFWVDFVTRPMYENDKVSDLKRVLLLNSQIACHYKINDTDEVILILKATHSDSLKPHGNNWEECNNDECEQQCVPDSKSCRFEVKE